MLKLTEDDSRIVQEFGAVKLFSSPEYKIGCVKTVVKRHVVKCRHPCTVGRATAT